MVGIIPSSTGILCIRVGILNRPGVLQVVLQQATVEYGRTVLERTAEDVAKHTAYIPCSRELGTEREVLIVSSQIQTGNVLWVVGIAVITTHIVSIDDTVFVEVDEYAVARIELVFNHLLGEWSAELLFIVGLSTLVVEFPELVLQTRTDAVATRVHIFILLRSLTVLDNLVLVV